ncbi:phosphatase PAP2 family protein [Athalassotoga saccharophila]|uniref:phosphatase PAP2 family protein n=1 Tax=Athalassotoga saccharophila TaxID=1441386 RepID=UPI00137AA51E|nr:phosphatase PAP2 family protein [Athalassotoga saccharophila]BBJ27661.1 phosphatidylglycerophosphatase B [Athalassotoga saccharophila]
MRKFWWYFSWFVIFLGIGILLGLIEKFGFANGLNIFVEKAVIGMRHHILNPYFIAVAKYTDTIYDIVIGLIVVVILSLLKKWREPLMLFISLTLAGILIEGLKYIYAIPRPNLSQLVPETSYSFPSGHSVGAFALYGMIAYFVLKSKLPKALSWTISIVISLFILSILYDRLYVGVHWLLDVIGGASIGIACMIIAIGIVKSIKGPKKA